MRRLLVLAPLVFVGCSLLGLSDYPLPTCEIEGGVLSDPCSALCTSPGCPGCSVYQCNTSSHRCELGPPDLDRDGDTAAYCGGTDCNDHDAKMSGAQAEVCDGIDNNCDGLIDEGTIAPRGSTQLAYPMYPGSPSISVDSFAGSTIASFTMSSSPGQRCIVAVNDSTFESTHCLPFPVDTGSPSQPYSRVLGADFPSIVASVYVRTDLCDGFAFRSTAGGAIDPKCSDGPGTLPSIIATDLSTTADAFATHYAASIAATCADVKPAPLFVRGIVSARTTTPTLTPTNLLSMTSASLRPAAFARGAGSVGIFVAAPDEVSGVGVWRIERGMTGGAVPTRVDVGTTLFGARSIDFAFGPGQTSGDVPFALVAELGCPPRQPVVLALGTMSFGPNGELLRTVMMRESVSFATAGDFALASPTVAWEGAPYNEWRVVWVDDGKVRLQRLTSAGKTIGAAITVSNGDSYAAVAAYVPGSRVVEVPVTMATDSRVVSVAVGCH